MRTPSIPFVSSRLGGANHPTFDRVLQAFFEKRNRLVKSLDQNSAVLDRLAQRIANQLSFLERVTGRIQKVSAERKQTLLDLYGAQEHLNMETSKRARLLESLKEAQVKVRSISSPSLSRGYSLGIYAVYRC